MKKILSTQCQNCLMTGDRIVSPEAAGQILKSCLEDGTYFICHRASMGDLGPHNTETMCKGFYDQYPQLYKLLADLKLITWIELKNDKKLPSWKETNHK